MLARSTNAFSDMRPASLEDAVGDLSNILGGDSGQLGPAIGSVQMYCPLSSFLGADTDKMLSQ